ncbi:AAA family ATPase [Acinetobacter colistiniresistens]|uniref:AAA family ATPase n=1 Tax=Acinetobacter colistiniresistens TaxID=280145 RepID=UPI0012506A18|nr:AAA family ATPase [Acinetobacter colistiniresistens]
MIIKSLILDNIGLYSQHTEFSLEPKKSSNTPNKPIILIGGRNGAGKTTFLDSEPYRVCRRVNILRDYPDDKTKLYPRN